MNDSHELCANCPLNPVRPIYKGKKAYCGHCHKLLSVSGDYCSKCGQKVEFSPPPDYQIPGQMSIFDGTKMTQ